MSIELIIFQSFVIDATNFFFFIVMAIPTIIKEVKTEERTKKVEWFDAIDNAKANIICNIAVTMIPTVPMM